MRTEGKRYVVARLKPMHGGQNKRVVMPSLDRFVTEVLAAVDINDYRYFWFETIDLETQYEPGILTYRTTTGNKSGKFFINAYVEEYEDVLVNNADLANQMTNLGWTHIARNIGVKSYWTEHFDPSIDELFSVELP